MSEGAYRYLRAPTVAHWCQRVPNEWCLAVSQGVYLCQMVPTCVCCCLWVSEDAFCCLRVTTGT